jgi:hypothetical protein
MPISGNDTMSARVASGDAVTGTGLSVLTVSPSTEPDTDHLPATSTLTPDDANPPLRAHKERRRTAVSHERPRGLMCDYTAAELRLPQGPRSRIDKLLRQLRDT